MPKKPGPGEHDGPAAEGLSIQFGATIREDTRGSGPAPPDHVPHEGSEGITRAARRKIARERAARRGEEKS